MQLLSLGIDVPQQDVVRNNILHKGSLVVLLLIIGLGRVQGHAGHGAHGASHTVVAAGENRIVKVGAPAGHGLEGLALDRDAAVLSGFDGLHIAGPLLADARQLAAGDHGSFVINDSDDAVGGFLKL